MNLPYRIEYKESFRVVGNYIQTTNKSGEGKKKIPEFWSMFKSEKLEESLMCLSNQEPKGLFGINRYNTDEADTRKFEYYIAVSSSCEVSDSWKEYTVPAMTWAIFPCTLETIGKTEVLAITKWLPKSKYKALNKGYITGRMKSVAPDIEYYGANGLVEVWVAVQEK